MGYEVLVVEDSSAMRTFIASTVEEIDGVTASQAGSGFEALKILPQHQFDLVITDINMPDINGLELIHFIKKIPDYQTVPLFIISTEGGERDREKGLSLGANEYLVKPFSPDDLETLVRKYLQAEG